MRVEESGCKRRKIADGEAGSVGEVADDQGKVLTGTATTGVQYVKASSIRVGDYIMIGDRACKVVTVSMSKTGKHGHAKVLFFFHFPMMRTIGWCLGLTRRWKWWSHPNWIRWSWRGMRRQHGPEEIGLAR